MLHKFRFVIAGVIIILVNQVVSFAVSASMPVSLRPAGTTRYAMVTASNATSTSVQLSWADISSLSQTITIPSGKRGDVMVLFCGATTSDESGVSQYVRALVGGAAASPSESVMVPTGQKTKHCANFYRLNVPEGTRNVRMQWHNSWEIATHRMYDRSMIVIVNIHD